MRSHKFPAAFRRMAFLVLAIVGIAVLAGHPLVAQTSNAQLSGQVTDSTGAVIPNAEVHATNTATNVDYVGTTNGAGIYVLPELLPGVYNIRVSAQGFGVTNRNGLTLSTGDHLAQNFALQLGSVETSVTVTGSVPLISSDEASTAAVLDNKMITELPQLNRNALDLTATVPAIQGSGPQVDNLQSLAQGNAAYVIANSGNSYSVSGGQVNGTSISVDGKESQLVFIDHAHTDMSVSNFCMEYKE